MNKLKDWWELSVNRLAEISNSSSYAYSAWHFSFMQSLWGLWLMLPFQTFVGSPYGHMASLASEFAWGTVAMLVGVAKMHFVIQRKPISLAILCLITGYMWVITGAAFLLGDYSNTGFIVYTMIGLHEFWLYKRLSAGKDRA